MLILAFFGRIWYNLIIMKDGECMYIGVDAGGTKTDICICDKAGKVIVRDISNGVNAARDGADAAARHIAARIISSGVTRAESIYAGIAGAGSPAIAAAAAEMLAALLPDISRIKVMSDAFNALNGEVGIGDGIALIAGTGSSAFVRTNGISRQVGGRGGLIDDAGSGYWTGRECLNAAFRALDGRGPHTSLTAAAEKKLGMALMDSIKHIYSGGAAYVASFAPLVFEHAENGDEVARAIASRCLDELLLHIRACVSGCESPPDICVASGGMFRNAYLCSAIAKGASTYGVRIVFPDVQPVFGAVITAAGDNANAEFKETLRNIWRG